MSQTDKCSNSYFSSSNFKSLPSVAGLQLTYTILFDSILSKVSIAVLSHPFLGGSTKTTSGIILLFSISSGNSFSTSPTKYSAFSILFRVAFCLASSIASGIVSIPYIFLALSDAKIPIVPIPQYKSNIVSFPF